MSLFARKTTNKVIKALILAIDKEEFDSIESLVKEAMICSASEKRRDKSGKLYQTQDDYLLNHLLTKVEVKSKAPSNIQLKGFGLVEILAILEAVKLLINLIQKLRS